MAKRLGSKEVPILVVPEEVFEQSRGTEFRIDDTLSIEVYFDPNSREEGFKDDIRIWLSDTGPADARLFPSDAIGLLLTADQAEQIAAALVQAAQASRATPR